MLIHRASGCDREAGLTQRYAARRRLSVVSSRAGPLTSGGAGDNLSGSFISMAPGVHHLGDGTTLRCQPAAAGASKT
jgi:hypothetical protein